MTYKPTTPTTKRLSDFSTVIFFPGGGGEMELQILGIYGKKRQVKDFNFNKNAAAAAKLLQSCSTLCIP